MRLGAVFGSRARGDGALKLAVPRGALLDGTLELLERIGVDTAAVRSDSRALVFEAGEPGLLTLPPPHRPPNRGAGGAPPPGPPQGRPPGARGGAGLQPPP